MTMEIINISDIPQIDNMEYVSRGTGARYLECTTHDNESGRHYIALQWRRKIPAEIPPWHVIIDFNFNRE